ncbi:glycosyltransferase [Actinobacteria bacterium IMCC26207]|nr:glycosyltransferase [Actinobacteria bacterium IMCC26207]
MSPQSTQTASERTRVLVNLTWLVPGVVGGSEESTTDALRAIAADLPADLEIHLAVLQPFLSAHPDLVESFSCHVLAASGSNKFARVLAEQTWLARLSRKIDAQVVHHAGGVVPLLHPGRVVLTIHDLQPLDLSENFSTTKRLYLRLMLGRSAKAADAICVPSEFTSQRVIALLEVDQRRIRIVPWCLRAIAPATTRSITHSEQSDSLEPSSVRAKLEQHGSPYFLYPAVTYPHKNHLMLLDAFALLRQSYPHTSLVLTGAAGPMEESVQKRMSQLDLQEAVQRTGRVSAAELEDLYAGASAVVLPSLYEGFGLPALEAMARGCLVIGSDRGSLPEVLAAQDLVDPEDLTAWAAAMQAVLVMSDSQRATRREAGLSRAAAFSPARTAAALCDSYRSVAVASGRRAVGEASDDT